MDLTIKLLNILLLEINWYTCQLVNNQLFQSKIKLCRVGLEGSCTLRFPLVSFKWIKHEIGVVSFQVLMFCFISVYCSWRWVYKWVCGSFIRCSPILLPYVLVLVLQEHFQCDFLWGLKKTMKRKWESGKVVGKVLKSG